MKRLFVLLVCLVAWAGTSLTHAEETIAQWSFVGSEAIANNGEGARITQLVRTDKSKNFAPHFFQQLGGLLIPGKFSDGTPPPAWIGHMLHLTSPYPSRGVWKRTADRKGSEFVLLVQLNEAKVASLEKEIIEEARKSGNVQEVTEKDWKGFTSGPAAFLRKNNQALVVLGGKPGTAIGQLQKLSEKLSGSETNFLQATIDGAMLVEAMPMLRQWVKPAKIDLNVFARKEKVRLTATVRFPQDTAWSGSEFLIPERMIRDPLISFTVGNNLAAFLGPRPWTQQLKYDPFARQFSAWGQTELPFQMNFALVEPKAQEELKKIRENLPAMVNPTLQKHRLGEIGGIPQAQDVLWKGLPAIIPFLTTTNVDGTSYLFSRIFVPTPSTNPPPAELLGQIKGRKDLIYYDWEITQERLQTWQMIETLTLAPYEDIRFSTQHISKKARANKITTEEWLTAASQEMGNAITEVTRANPREVKIVRASDGLFTAWEWVVLTRVMHQLVPVYDLPAKKATSTPAVPVR
jgi:hypothetical protein